MASKRYVVRVVQTHKDDGTEIYEGGEINGAFLDCLRYAGCNITVHDPGHHTLTSLCIDIECPHHITTSMSKGWAERNAARMQSFGFNAVAAPSTK